MKYKKLIFTVITIMLLLSTVVTPVFAESTGFVTEPVPEDQIDRVSRFTNITMLADEPRKMGIVCFDVDENGMVAVGCHTLAKDFVSVYTNDGVFQYAYSFTSDGSFGVELDGDTLIIYFEKSDIALSVNTNGEITDVVRIPYTPENNSYWKKDVYATRKKVGNTEYVIKRDLGSYNFFALSYSRLIAINSDGEESIIYDANPSVLLDIKIRIVFMFIVACICVVVFTRLAIKSRRGGW